MMYLSASRNRKFRSFVLLAERWPWYQARNPRDLRKRKMKTRNTGSFNVSLLVMNKFSGKSLFLFIYSMWLANRLQFCHHQKQSLYFKINICGYNLKMPFLHSRSLHFLAFVNPRCVHVVNILW